MTINLRVSLTIFSIGFALEAGEDVYYLVTGSVRLFAGGLLFAIGIAATVLGLLFLTIGRHEWNELHRDRVRSAHWTFATVVLLGVAAALPVAYYLYRPGTGMPAWAALEVGAAVAGSLFFTFILYAVIVYHLLGRAGRAVLVGALAAAVPVCGDVGWRVSQGLPSYLLLARSSPLTLVAVVEPIVSLLSYMFLAYLLFLAAFVAAHRRVAQGAPVRSPARWVPPSAPPSSPPPGRSGA